MSYDANGNLADITDAFNRTLTITPNANGTVAQISDALGTIAAYEYYPSTTLLKTVTYNDGSKYKFEYDTTTVSGKVFLKTVKDALDNVLETHQYDSQGRATTSEKAGSVEKYTLDYTNTDDSTNPYTIVTDALGRTTKYYIDKNKGRNVISKIEGNCNCGGGSQTTTFEYDEAGNRKKRTDYAGRETTYEYDALNRLKKTNYLQTLSGVPVQTPISTATYTYDDISQLKTAINEAGTVSFNYDSRNRIQNTTDVFGHLVEYEYELTPTVNQKRIKFDGALYAKYNFDDANRLSNILNSSDNTTITFGYDNADRLTSRTYPNNVTTTLDYDGMSRLTRLKDISATAILFDRRFYYNAANQIDLIGEPDYARSFSYDNVNRLTSLTYGQALLTGESYAYDDAGNRTSSHKSSSYIYQANNKLTSTQTANYSYDTNGNLVSKSEGKEFWRYAFDYENRLTTASTRKQTARYVYDALGRRVQRHIKGSKENTKFIYDGQDVLVDDNSGTLTKYLNGAGIDSKLRMQTGSSVNYFLADHLGSTNGLTNSSGAITSQASYESFGSSTNNLTTRYQYTGREFDNFTGLYFYRARWYDSNLGRVYQRRPDWI